MSFLGGGLDKATRRYKKSKREFEQWRMDQNKALLQQARGYADLGPESDIAYDTISGQYLTADSNPYISGVADQAAQRVAEQYNKGYIPQSLSAFAGSGRYGSGLFQQTLADTQSQMNQDIANASNQLYYQNYVNERALQENARTRAASQYDPLNRYGEYQSMLNTGSGSGSGSNGVGKGSFLGAVGTGAAAGGAYGGGWGALIGGAIGAGAYLLS